MSNTDAQYLMSSVQRLQSHHDVKKIIAGLQKMVDYIEKIRLQGEKND